MSTLLMFPGQGSQRVDMCAPVAERHPHEINCVSEILGFDLVEIAAQPDLLRDTRYLQPALFVVEYFDYLDHWADIEDEVIFAGHSVGEVTALCAAGAFEFFDGLRLVNERARAMHEVRDGAMAAVMRISRAELDALLEEFPDVDVANLNGYTQFVLSGPTECLEELCDRIDDLDGLAVTLRVSGPFHSRYMRAAAARFTETLAGITLSTPAHTVLSNVTARPYGNVPELLARQLYSPVDWTSLVEYAVGSGADTFIEVAPGSVLSGIATRMNDSAGWGARIVTGDAYAV